MHKGSENQPWGKALPLGATWAARVDAPSHCKMRVHVSNTLQSPLLQAVALGTLQWDWLNNSLEWINQGMAAAWCRSLGWVGVPALCSPRLHSSSWQPGFAPWAQHFSTNEDLWTWVVLSKSCVPVWLGMWGRKLSILQGPVPTAWLQQVSWPALTH